MAEKRHVQHLRSKVVENGKAKLPTSESLYWGEIAVNYAKGYETLSIKNESGDVVTFHPDEIQIGTSADTISDNTTVFIDTDEDKAVLVYTQEQVDSQISGVTNLIDEDIIISSETPTSVNTELWVDTTNDGDPYDVYTKTQVDSFVAELQRQIDELKNRV